MYILETIISLLAPHDCLSCGQEGQLLCAWCLPEFLLASTAGCFRCGKRTLTSHICNSCKPDVPFGHLWIGTDYKDFAKQLVRQFKFNSARSAAQPMAMCMKMSLPFLDKTVIVPVPTATSRVRQRGYDHTKLLAKELSGLTGLMVSRALRRRGQTRQVGTQRNQRLKQLKGAYYIKNSSLVRDKHILLLDDVTTTGSTIVEAARTVKQAGAKTINVVTFAHKPLGKLSVGSRARLSDS